MKLDTKKIFDIVLGIYFSLVGVTVLFISFIFGITCSSFGCRLSPYGLLLFLPIYLVAFFISYKTIKGMYGKTISVGSIIFSTFLIAISLWLYSWTTETFITLLMASINSLFTIVAVIRYFLVTKRIR